MIYYQDNQFVNGFDVEFLTLEESKADRIAVIDFIAECLRNKVTKGTSPAEMSSWPLKLAEANAGGGPMLTLEASYRGISEASLVELVLQSASQLSVLEAKIAGISGMHRDAITAMTTIEEVCAYDMRNGWPEV